MTLYRAFTQFTHNTTSSEGELGCQSVVKLFHKSITLGMQQSSPSLSDGQPPADLTEHASLKAHPLDTAEMGLVGPFLAVQMSNW